MKNNKNAWLYPVAGLLITANIITLAMLWMHRGGHDTGRDVVQQRTGGPFEFLSKELKLTKQQQDAYIILRDEHRRNSRELQDSIREAKDALFTLLKQDTVKPEELTQRTNNAAALSSRLDLVTFHHFQKLRALCTPEQQKRFDEIIREAMRGMGQQGPPRGGPRQGPPQEDGPQGPLPVQE